MRCFERRFLRPCAKHAVKSLLLVLWVRLFVTFCFVFACDNPRYSDWTCALLFAPRTVLILTRPQLRPASCVHHSVEYCSHSIIMMHHSIGRGDSRTRTHVLYTHAPVRKCWYVTLLSPSARARTSMTCVYHSFRISTALRADTASNGCHQPTNNASLCCKHGLS